MRFRILTLGITCAVVASALAGEAPADGGLVSAPEATYAQRVAASPRNQPLAVDSFVIPHAHALNVVPQPFVARAGRPALFY
ncbi:hypothetical protein HQ576_19895, partial [bacterium]|nr:hypothetical protein [bacterium]